MKLFISKLHYKKNLTAYEKVIISLLKVLSFFYGSIVNIRNSMYDKKIIKSHGSKAFIVSIGNITTGGVGKTPITLEAAKYFLAMNKKVAIVSRGYGSKLSGNKPNLISDGSGPLFSASVAGDEPYWLSENCKGAYVVTSKSRLRAEKYLAQTYAPDVIILDDAFQHRKIKRDIDILLIDSKNKFGNKYLLPAGPLRENIQSINRADKIIVVNKSYETDKALMFCDNLKKKFSKSTYLCKMVPENIYNIKNKEILPYDTRIMAFSAIGQPSGFFDFLKKDYKLVAVLEFEDHHRYDKSDISKIIEFAQEENIEHVVTTEKDAVKLIDLVKDVDIPIKIYSLKLKAYLDIKEVLGE